MDRAPKALAPSATIGLLLLLTSLTACFTSGYALHRALAGDRYSGPISAGGGLIWGLIVFCLDRGLLLGLNKSAPSWKLALQAAPRVLLAFALGLSISKPLTLRICRPVLDTYLRQQRRRAIAAEASQNARIENLPELRAQATQLQQLDQSQQARLRGKPDSYEYRVAEEDLREATVRYERIYSVNRNRIDHAHRELSEIASQRYVGSEARRDALQEDISRWRHEISLAGTSVASARNMRDKAQAEWLQTETARLHDFDTELQAANRHAAVATQRVQALDAESQRKMDQLMRNTLAFEYVTLGQVEDDKNNPYSSSLSRIAWGLDAIFVLLEICPMMIKLFSPIGALDHAVSATEFEDQERINSEANATAKLIQKQAEVRVAVATRQLEKSRDDQINLINNSDPAPRKGSKNKFTPPQSPPAAKWRNPNVSTGKPNGGGNNHVRPTN